MSMHFHREGAGPSLILLHGIGHHWQAWRPVIARLSDGFDVIACDSPGFGRSDPLPPDVDPTIPAYTDAFERWLAASGLGEPHVAGNSMGGAIALELARRGAVASATALSPAGFWTAAERRYCQWSLGALLGLPASLRPAVLGLSRTRAGRAVLFAQLCRKPTHVPANEAEASLIDAWRSPAFARALEALTRYRYTASGQHVSVPVTVAWGDRDLLLPYRLQAPRARRILPDARHLALGVGHLPFFDDPDAVADVIRSGTQRGRAPR